MKTLTNVIIKGWREETHLSYDYLEELQEILKHFNLKVGSNKLNGVEFIINNNGGELNLVIPNFMTVHHNIPFEVTYNNDEHFFESSEKSIKKLIWKVNQVAKFLEGFEKY